MKIKPNSTKISIFFVAILLLAFSPAIGQKNKKNNRQEYVSKKFTTWDFIYEPTIKTVVLFPYTGSKGDYLNPSVSPINQSVPLLLAFDDLKENAENFIVKIVHCNADWTESFISSTIYLEDYNEFIITDRKPSINTKIPYIHYSYFIPRLKISGNYVVKVYRDYNEDDLILTKRFMIYDNLVSINPNIQFPQKVSERNTGQQVNFTIHYPTFPLINPSMSLHVAIRQNHRWDKMIAKIPPLFVRENDAVLDYNYFNMENGFSGGNEYSAFDISSFITTKLNVGKIAVNPEFTEVILLQDKPRASEPYSLVPDIDGKFFIDQYEFGDGEISADYAWVNFVLNAPVMPGKIFVIGGMNDFRLTPEFEMIYNPEIKKYTCRVLLKQGYYNYKYTIVDEKAPYGNDIFFTGTHSQTQNRYEILTYYRPIGERTDLLIGYKEVNFMERR